MIIFALLVAVIAGHVYQYTSLFTIMFKNTWLFNQVLAKIQGVKKQAKNVRKSKLSASEPQSRSTEGHQEHYDPLTMSLMFTIVKFIL